MTDRLRENFRATARKLLLTESTPSARNRNPSVARATQGMPAMRYNLRMRIIIVREPVDESTLSALAEEWHHALVKGVADIEQGIAALGGEWHMDANNRLVEEGSRQENLWGFNVYPKERGDAAIEYISLINIRPAQGNRGMEIENDETRTAVRKTVAKAIPFLGL